jgi:acetoacetate decarboxylase
MDKNEIKKRAFAMPLTSPAYPRGPYRFINREFFIIRYETTLDSLKAVVPEPLQVTEPIVNFEFIRMPDSTGFGDYTESGQVIPVTYKGEKGSYVHAMYLDDEAPIAAGREIWGYPKKLANPSLKIKNELLIGKLDYDTCTVVTATMGYKHQTLDPKNILPSLLNPNYLLKIIPDVDGSTRICELIEVRLEDVTVKGAWTGPVSIELFSHAMAPVSDLPIVKILSGMHIMTDLTLPYGKVMVNYLEK